MEILRANSYAQFRERLTALDIGVPEKLRDRKNEHVELYCAAHLLATLPESRFAFPLSLYHLDRPDFRLDLGGDVVGIEHTEAVPENVAHAQSMRDDGAGSDTFFEPYAEPGEAKRSAKKLLEEIDADEAGDGWVGDGSQMWVDVILQVVRKKLSKASGFTRYQSNWLLIYDNWPNPGVRVEKAAPHLAPLLRSAGAFNTFDRIFVIRGDRLVEYTENSTEVHDIVSPAQSFDG